MGILTVVQRSKDQIRIELIDAISPQGAQVLVDDQGVDLIPLEHAS
jgi:hypothetical protein